MINRWTTILPWKIHPRTKCIVNLSGFLKPRGWSFYFWSSLSIPCPEGKASPTTNHVSGEKIGRRFKNRPSSQTSHVHNTYSLSTNEVARINIVAVLINGYTSLLDSYKAIGWADCQRIQYGIAQYVINVRVVTLIGPVTLNFKKRNLTIRLENKYKMEILEYMRAAY